MSSVVTYPEYYDIDGTRYDRITTILSALGSKEYADAHILAEGARSSAEAALQGEYGTALGCDPVEWLQGPGFKDDIVSRFTRLKQGMMDRGTIINDLFDVLLECGPLDPVGVEDTLLQLFNDRAVTAHQQWQEWAAARDAGLVEKQSPKPVRAYQCSMDDVLPYAFSLARWHASDAFDLGIRAKQVLAVDESRMLAGTADYIGCVGGRSPDVIELKTQKVLGPPQIRLENVVQVSTYTSILRKTTKIRLGACLLIVGLDTVSLRRVTPAGMRQAARVLNRLLWLHRNKGVSGLTYSQHQTAALAA